MVVIVNGNIFLMVVAQWDEGLSLLELEANLAAQVVVNWHL